MFVLIWWGKVEDFSGYPTEMQVLRVFLGAVRSRLYLVGSFVLLVLGMTFFLSVNV